MGQSEQGRLTELFELAEELSSFDNARRSAGKTDTSAFLGFVAWFVGLNLGGLPAAIAALHAAGKAGNELEKRLRHIQDENAECPLSQFSDEILDKADNRFYDKFGHCPSYDECGQRNYLEICHELAKATVQRPSTGAVKANDHPRHVSSTTRKSEKTNAGYAGGCATFIAGFVGYVVTAIIGALILQFLGKAGIFDVLAQPEPIKSACFIGLVIVSFIGAAIFAGMASDTTKVKKQNPSQRNSSKTRAGKQAAEWSDFARVVAGIVFASSWFGLWYVLTSVVDVMDRLNESGVIDVDSDLDRTIVVSVTSVGLSLVAGSFAWLVGRSI